MPSEHSRNKSKKSNQPKHLKLASIVIIVIGVSIGISFAQAFSTTAPEQPQISEAHFEPVQLVNQLDDTSCSSEDTYTDIDKAIAHADTACALNISFENIAYLPPTIGKLQQLKEFRSRGNQIATMPKEFWELRSLQLLDVMDSDFADFNDSIGNLTELRKLEVGGTHITSVPDALNKLTHLEFFDIMDTPVTVLPKDMSQLIHLKDVDIDETAVVDVSPLVGLPIQRLIADYNEGIQIDTIAQLTTLKELSLSGCFITSIPKDFANLQSLVKLNLSNNQLTTVSGLKSPLRHVRQLSLAKNQLTDSAADIQKLFPHASITGIKLTAR